MKRWICTVLVFVLVLGNASVCHAEEYTNAVEKSNTELYALRATGHFSFSEVGLYTIKVSAMKTSTSSEVDYYYTVRIY